MSSASEKRPKGRPSDYTQELADEICERLSEGQSLRTVCSDDKMPSRKTVFSWMRKHPDFLNQYARAKQEAADALAEEILDISDDAEAAIKGTAEKKSSAMAQAYRLRVDTRKFIMAKMKPKKYGEKIDLTTNGKDLPTPIMGGTSVSTDNNVQEDSKS